MGLEDYLLYKHSIKNKEEMIQMLNENQEEYTRIAQKSEAIFLQSEKYVLVLDDRKDFNEAGLYSDIFNYFPIRVLSIDDEENGIYTYIGSYYKYETEWIMDDWYYYQCMTT